MALLVHYSLLEAVPHGPHDPESLLGSHIQSALEGLRWLQILRAGRPNSQSVAALSANGVRPTESRRNLLR